MSKHKNRHLNESTGLLDANDEDGFMARSQLYFMARDAITLHGMIGDRDELPPWLSAKITKAAEAIEAAREYIEYKKTGAEEVPADAGVPADAEGEFHNQLDDLVHDTFGDSPDERVKAEEELVWEDWEREAVTEKDDPCWKNYEMVGMKKKNGKEVPNCVPKKESVEEGADLDDGSKALNPQTIAQNMMKAARAQAMKKVKK